MPICWLLFALRFTGRDSWLSARGVAALSLVPAVLYLLVLTDGTLHHWYYRETRTIEVGG